MKRDEVLDKAKELINGQRAKDYGDAYHNHGRIAEGWNIFISGALKSHGHVTAAHVALMMDWVKTTMIDFGVISHDDLELLHLVDSVDEAIEIIANHYKNTYNSAEHSKIVF